MTLPLFRLLNRLTFRKRSGNRARPRAYRAWHRPVLEPLEDRTLPATIITVTPGAAGAAPLDPFLTPTDGTTAATDTAGPPGTVPAGALAAVGAAVNISITAETSIGFNDLGGNLNLQTGAGNSA